MRFRIKGGQAAIYDQSVHGDLPLTKPLDYLDDLKWHNELEHIGIVEIKDYTVNLPQSNSYSVAHEETHILGPHGRPAEPFVYGYVTLPGGQIRPFSMHAPVSIAKTTTELAGIKPHAFPRTVSLGIDGANIVLHEWARGIYWDSDKHSAVTIGVRVFITDLSLSELGNATPAAPDRSFRVNATTIKLGPFDAAKRYLHVDEDGSPQFPLVNGCTAYGGTRINWVYTVPSPSDFAFSMRFGTASISGTTVVDIAS